MAHHASRHAALAAYTFFAICSLHRNEAPSPCSRTRSKNPNPSICPAAPLTTLCACSEYRYTASLISCAERGFAQSTGRCDYVCTRVMVRFARRVSRKCASTFPMRVGLVKTPDEAVMLILRYNAVMPTGKDDVECAFSTADPPGSLATSLNPLLMPYLPFVNVGAVSRRAPAATRDLGRD